MKSLAEGLSALDISDVNKSMGLEKLTQAEKRCKDLIDKTIKENAQRLKEAEVDAHQCVKDLELKYEREFEEYSKTLTNRDLIETEIKTELAQKISDMRESTAKSEEKAMDLLIHAVLNVEPKLHQNYCSPKHQF